MQRQRRKLVAMTRVYVEGPDYASDIYDAVIDTGFSGHLALPGYAIDELNLEPAGTIRSLIASGETREFQLSQATVIFGAREQTIRVHRTESATLVGMSLLSGYVLKIDARAGGAIELEVATG